MRVIILVPLFALLTGAAVAHHGWGSYDATQPVTVAGPIITSKFENPHATITQYPGVYKIDAPGRLVVKRESVEERLGRPWDPQDIHLTLVSLSGNIDETDDYFALERV